MTSNQDTITAFLSAKGLTPAQIAGVEGNLRVESGFSPTAYNAGEKAIGIAQWEGPRRTALQAYARATGGSERSLATQLNFMWKELTGSESGAYAKLRKTTTPTAAAAAWDQYFERSSGEARATRESYARQIAGSFGSSVQQVGFLDAIPGALLGAGGSAAAKDPGGAVLGGALGVGGEKAIDVTGDAVRAAAAATWSAAGDLVVKGGAMTLGLALVALGAYRLSQASPTVAAAGHVAGAPVRAARKGATAAATKGASSGPPAKAPTSTPPAPKPPRPRPAPAAADVAPF